MQYPQLRLALLFFCLYSFTTYTFGQQLRSASPWVRTYQYDEKATAYRLPADWSPTAVVVRALNEQALVGAYLASKLDTLWLEPNPHTDDLSGVFSNVESLPHPELTYQLYFPKTVDNEFELILINSGTAPEIQRPAHRTMDESYCEAPPVISQSEWRAGLPNPTGTRGFATINNLIVHHSAGSNTNTNYTQVVRDIYVFHTQYRGWSDVGYNYLISQNGDLYLGRDPQGGDQDRVIGAHFCGGNTGTMGVCLLGTFTNQAPADTMLGTLERLLSWKAYKDEMDPESTASHRLNSTLGVIAGHRDGCATECPGEQTYLLLDEMRARVAARILICDEGIPPVDTTTPPDSVVVFQLNANAPNTLVYANNPERVGWEEAHLIDMQGRQLPLRIRDWDINTWELRVSGYPPGFYILHLPVGKEVQHHRIRVN